MISRRSVWIAFFGFVLAEIIIGCQGADLSAPGGSDTPRATGYGAHGFVPPLKIADPPNSPALASEHDKGDSVPVHLTEVPHLEKEVSTGASHDAAPAETASDLKKLHEVVMNRAEHLESYIARFRRREVVDGKDQAEECITLKYRGEPWSVDMKWLKPDDIKGREVLYVKGHYENKLHIVVEKKKLVMGGTKLSFDLNNPLVRDGSRHDITAAGIHEFVRRFDSVFCAMSKEDRHLGTLVWHGETKRPEFDKEVLMVEHVMPPGYEPLLPHGGHRFLYFDPDEKLPMLVITQDEHGREVEYYCYDGLQANVKLDDADFNPANMVGMGGKK
jgi:hypothetical protein